jgi:RND family efflux transporter MFP subunit
MENRMSPETPKQPVSRRALRIAAFVTGALAAAVVAGGIASRIASGRQLRTWTDAQAQPVVSLTLPQPGAASSVLTLPGRLEAYARAPIYARVNGYVKYWRVDIGGRVRAGQLLAELEAPELDQQVSQARADLLTAQANAALARTTARRWQQLVKSDAVSRQEVDMKNGDFAAKEAIVKATEANVDRLVAMEGFKHIVAPFDGIVTTRATDVGALINAGSGKGLELFVVSETTKLRLYVNVPQNYVAEIAAGARAEVTVPERPGRTFAATVETTAESVDPASGATLVQLSVDNSAGELLPGAFANVRFDLARPPAALGVPASALIIDSAGTRVATLGPDNRVAFRPVTVARDLGTTIEIASGLKSTDRIIDSPPDGIGEGDPVRIAPGSPPGGMLVHAAAPARSPGEDP